MYTIANIPLEGWGCVKNPVSLSQLKRLNKCNIVEEKSIPRDGDSKIRLVTIEDAELRSLFITDLAWNSHAIVVDFEKSTTIGGNYVTGGIIRAGFIDAFINNKKGEFIFENLKNAYAKVASESDQQIIDFLEDVVYSVKTIAEYITIVGDKETVEKTNRLLLENFEFQARMVVFSE